MGDSWSRSPVVSRAGRRTLLRPEGRNRPTATVIAERIGWGRLSLVLRAKIAVLRPLFAPPDPADRTAYVAGEIVQCDL